MTHRICPTPCITPDNTLSPKIDNGVFLCAIALTTLHNKTPLKLKKNPVEKIRPLKRDPKTTRPKLI